MNVSLTPHLDSFIDQQVSSGRYRSASEVVRDGLRLLENRESQTALIQEALEEGLNSELLNGEKSMEKLRNKLQLEHGV